jgi:hypothetical protein
MKLARDSSRRGRTDWTSSSAIANQSPQPLEAPADASDGEVRSA